MTAIEPMGARVEGIDLKTKVPPAEVLKALQDEMAYRGFIVFGGQGVMSGDEQVFASKLWGGRKMHSTHGVHPRAPNKHIFRLSNDPNVGINGVGPQWHNDGSFCLDVFSHVGYHIVKVPENGGNTIFSH
jgi:taurine dioxygenase